MSEPDHILHGQLTSEGYWNYKLECILGQGEHHSFTESRNGCECRCAPCLDDDHSGCEIYGGSYIEEVGYECQCERDDTECWVTYWLAEVGGECIHGNNWPVDCLPAPVHCTCSDGLVITYGPPT